MTSSNEELKEGNSKPVTSIAGNVLQTVGFSKVTESLLELMERTGYRVVQVNGQRRYGGPPPNWKGPPPPKESEVFVGKIPRDCYEDELVPVFEKVGQIYELRLMMDFSGTTRGYGFVMYSSPGIASLAVTTLNDYEIRPGRRIGVVKSVNNCRLFVGGIPVGISVQEVKEVLGRITEDVTDVWLHKSTNSGPGIKSRSANFGTQYAIVEYESHRSAAMARRRLIPDRIELWGREIIVDWATPSTRPKPSERNCEDLDFKNNEAVTSLQSCPDYYIHSHTADHNGDSGVGTVSSGSSSNWSLEQAMDDVLYGMESSTLYVRKEVCSPVQHVKTASPNVHNLSSSKIQVLNSPFSKMYENSSKLSPAFTMNRDVEEINGPEIQGIQAMDNHVTVMPEISYGSQMPSVMTNKTTDYQLSKNLSYGNSFLLDENYDPRFVMQGPQANNYSGGCYGSLENVYLNGTTRAQILFNDSLQATGYIKLPVHERPVLTELTGDQRHTFDNVGGFNKPNFGRAIRGPGFHSRGRTNTIPSSSFGILASPAWIGHPVVPVNVQQLTPSLTHDESSFALNDKGNVNNWKETKCFPEHALDVGGSMSPKNIMTKLSESASWLDKPNLSAHSESVFPVYHDSPLADLRILTAAATNQNSKTFSEALSGTEAVNCHNHCFNRAPGTPVFSSRINTSTSFCK